MSRGIAHLYPKLVGYSLGIQDNDAVKRRGDEASKEEGH